MDFAFNEEQQMLRASVRNFLAQKLPLERVTALAAGEAPDVARETYTEMAGLGWTGLAASGDHGGSGMGFIEEAVVFEELGYALYPGPFFATVALSLPLLRDPDLIGSITSGETRATLAWAEPGRAATLRDLGALSTKAEGADGSWTLSGEKHLVTDLLQADIALVIAESANGPGVWSVATRADGVASEGQSTMDSTRNFGRLMLQRAAAEEVVVPGEAGPALAAMRRRALAALALEAVGICRRALELSVEYAKDRRQFDRPIGAYQAVSQRIADIYMETELARSLAYWAAWCVEVDDDNAERAALSAKAFAADAAVRSAERAIQVHGGIGFTWEHILHRFYKRAQWIEAFEGYGPSHRIEVAASLLP